MKNNKALIVTNIILLSCIVIGLLIFMIFGISGKITFEGINAKLVDTKVYHDSSLHNVKINVKSFDIKLESNPNDELVVEVYGSEKTKKNIEIENENGILKINQIKSTMCFGFCPSTNIVIKLPNNYEGKYDINTISGEITSRVNFYSDDNNITSTSGDIKLLDVKSGNIKSTSGEISINSLASSKVRTTSGDIEINTLNNGEVYSTSGEIEIDSFIGAGEISTTSGDIRINNFEIENNTNISSTSGDIRIKLLNEAYISAESVSGDKNIKNSRGEYDLKLKTISGDITVK